jgi:predicted nucleic acid-binding protein
MIVVVDTNVWVSAFLKRMGLGVSEPYGLPGATDRDRQKRTLLKLCRDPDDDLLLETAVRGGAEYAISRNEDVTRDADLTQKLGQYGVRTITVQRFLDLLQSSEDREVTRFSNV